MGYFKKETRYSLRGTPFPDWEYRRLRMPRISDDLLDCAVYLYKDSKSALKGVGQGGSGFLVGVPFGMAELRAPSWMTSTMLSNRDPFLYVVTNWHVIRKGFRAVRFNTLEGLIDAVELTSWACHPTADLAIHRVPDNLAYKYKYVPYNIMLTPGDVAYLDIGVGDDVVSVGRFVHVGKQSNRPVARFGHIAMMPFEDEPIAVEHYFDDHPKIVRRKEVSFLVESLTIPGYSGSPVFLRVPPWELREAQEGTFRRELARRFFDQPGNPAMELLGVSWGWIYGQDEEVPLKVGGRECKADLRPNTGMMGVVPSWKLLELLNKEEVVKERDELIRDDQPPGGGAG
jgi:hypothetical protein